jgi:hypothetical protein
VDRTSHRRRENDREPAARENSEFYLQNYLKVKSSSSLIFRTVSFILEADFRCSFILEAVFTFRGRFEIGPRILGRLAYADWRTQINGGRRCVAFP